MAHVSKHGQSRAQERIGIPKRSVQKMAEQALAIGGKHSDFAGQFKRYLDGIFLQERKANNMRVFSEHLFLFQGETLITVWRVPHRYVAAANSYKRVCQ